MQTTWHTSDHQEWQPPASAEWIDAERLLTSSEYAHEFISRGLDIYIGLAQDDEHWCPVEDLTHLGVHISHDERTWVKVVNSEGDSVFDAHRQSADGGNYTWIRDLWPREGS